MDWKKTEEGKPEVNCACYVCNVKFSHYGYLAYYFKEKDYFQCVSNKMPMEVTHYVQLPDMDPSEFPPTTEIS